MKTRHLKTLGLCAGVVVTVALAHPTPISLAAGSVFVLAGEAVRCWAAGHLRRKQEVTTSGPYAYVRDPLYLGRLLLLVGFCVMAWGYGLLLLPVGLIIFFLNYLPRKYEKEMAWLTQLFGEEYTRYAGSVKSLLPRMRPYPQASRRSWSGGLFWDENREQYFIGIIGSVWVSLVVRYVLLHSGGGV